MRFSTALVVGCLALVVYSGASLFAEERQEAACCGSPGDCTNGDRCCDPGSVGQPPCSDDAPGICMPTCIATRR
jgi:hypothetical protein